MPSTTYGALEMSAKTLALIGIASSSLLVLTIILYLFKCKWGLVPHFMAFVGAIVLIVTFWTSISWNDLGPLPLIGAIVILMIMALPAAMLDDDMT